MGIASQAAARSNLVELEHHAADNLQFIRDTMERAAAFTAVPGWGGVAIGFTALVAGWIAQHYPPDAQFWIWLGEGLLAAALGIAALRRKSKRIASPLSSRSARRALLSFATPLLAATMLTVALFRFAQIGLFAGVWLLLYGVAVVTAGAFSVRIVPVMGFGFLLLGSLALLTPSAFANAWMMLGFGGLHVLFGFLIARKHGG
jgi:MFS family permease